MKQLAAVFLVVSFLTVEASYIWMIWDDNQLAGKVALTALIVFANALFICLGMIK